MEEKTRLKQRISKSKETKDLVYGEKWRGVIDPLLIGEFEKLIVLALTDRAKELDYLNDARAIYKLCDRLGKSINIGEQAKKVLYKLQHKR